MSRPPQDLLSAFRAAALSVTTLYKSAASLQAPARAEGYQDAIEDLLLFLDKEHIGLGDGEGWRIRQWATGKLDGQEINNNENEEEEEEQHQHQQQQQHHHHDDEEQVENNVSDQTPADQESTVEDLAISVELPPREPVELVKPTTAKPNESTTFPSHPISQDVFTFRSQHQYPTNHQRDVSMDGLSITDSMSNNNSNAFVKPDISTKSNRHRHQRTNNQRSSHTSRGSLGTGAGSKRKIPFENFFDLGGVTFDSNHGSERGGKRGRHN